MRKKKKKRVKKQYHLAVDFGEPDELKNIVILTTPRGSEGLMELLTRQRDGLFEWQEHLMSQFRERENHEPFWAMEQEFMQSPHQEPFTTGDRFTRAHHNAMFGRLNADRLACAGCSDILHNPKKFPVGYPKDKMLCCRCFGDYAWSRGYTHDEIINISGVDYEYDHKYRWNLHKEKIEKIMRIQ